MTPTWCLRLAEETALDLVKSFNRLCANYDVAEVQSVIEHLCHVGKTYQELTGDDPSRCRIFTDFACIVIASPAFIKRYGVSKIGADTFGWILYAEQEGCQVLRNGISVEGDSLEIGKPLGSHATIRT